MRKGFALFAGVALTLGACSAPGDAQTERSAATQQSAVHAESGLPLVPLTIESGGRTHRFTVEYAASDEDQRKGLMFRTELGPDEGMLFPNGTPQQRSFWMKNTVIPLDLIFIAPDRTIESIAADAVPYSLDPIPSQGAVVGVLELAGGRAAELGLSPGDAIDWRAPGQ
ncbi:DUF192 domain-containing protein [Croceicoccus sp. YJ47]|uniref:DUF192 domain-containing protein n=1 Tax=Croceicoccus sp. YJ47 TaxID=2798724 RepID=UPI001924B23D|nr:DUF192 domain-containing protein [Croceicoccus sp. YJ47]QQN73226.1 DUF192 domain-containing protein [Croceicoccus sp. YJ47]